MKQVIHDVQKVQSDDCNKHLVLGQLTHFTGKKIYMKFVKLLSQKDQKQHGAKHMHYFICIEKHLQVAFGIHWKAA